MPQLDPSSFITQIFWLTITFLTLWFVMSWFVLPRIRNIFEEREQKIESYIQKAQKINKQALQSLDRYEKAIEKAKEEADRKIIEEKEKQEAEIEFKKAQVNQELTRKVEDIERMLKKERLETLEAVDEVSLRAADFIIEKLGLKL